MSWIIVGFPLSLPELKWLLVGERLGDGFTMYRDLYDHTGPLSAMVYKWLDFLFGRSRWVHIVFSSILVTVQASILNSILLKNKAFEENNYLPAFFYVICSASVLDFFALSPQLMSITFILLALNQIFRRIDNVITDELFLYSGIYLGLAAFFYLPAVIFFVIFLVSFILFSSAILRRLLLFIYGTFAVFVVVWAYFFWHEAAYDFLNSFFGAGVQKPKIFYLEFVDLLKVGGFLCGVLLLGLTILVTQRSTNFQQKMQRVMTLFIIAGVIAMVVNRELMVADLVFFVPSTAFFLSYYFLGIRRRVWRLTMPYLVVFGLIAYPFLFIDGEELQSSIVQSSEPYTGSVMGITSDISVYRNAHIAGPFLDEYVSRCRLENLEYFDEAPRLFQSLNESDADIILDEWGMAGVIFHRFPSFARRYEQTGPGEYRLISN